MVQQLLIFSWLLLALQARSHSGSNIRGQCSTTKTTNILPHENYPLYGIQEGLKPTMRNQIKEFNIYTDPARVVAMAMHPPLWADLYTYSVTNQLLAIKLNHPTYQAHTIDSWRLFTLQR